MKPTHTMTTGLLILCLSLVVSFVVPATAADTYQLDPEHTSVVFRVKHLGVAYVYGRFNGPGGSFVFDEKSPGNSSIEIQVNAQNVDTAVKKRDNHLKSPDFFNAEENPVITFKSTSVKKAGKDDYEVAGNLTLLGKTRPITVIARQTGGGKDPWGNYRRGFETSFAIKRSDFGMNFMMGGVSDDVQLTVSVEGIRQK
ncbi:MAG: YceI family protein [Deltaproteobacteria bacterium]|nr:YceI family protein [Deltaproteobacteria bacterium]